MDDTNTQSPGDVYSYMAPCGYTSSSSCGYCGAGRRGNTDSAKRFSYYASSSSMTPEYYQILLDRYWRRSGSLLYRPNQKQCCCPHYTIRLDSEQYSASRNHRQTINRFNKHVLGPEYAAAAGRLHPRPRSQPKKSQQGFDLIERVHEAEVGYLKIPPEPAHKFFVTLEEDSYTEEKYKVFENYQRIVHKEGPSDISRGGFRRFLCDSPVQKRKEITPEGTEKLLGSYHMCYWLDGELVGIGVLDLLPHCVSSVYFLYHESFHQFAPGKLSAIREIALAKEGGYRYWYPGYYIHSCPKMRYKMDYRPQYILDPETLTWDPLDQQILQLLDSKSYVSLSAERRGRKDGNSADGQVEGASPKATDADEEEEVASMFDSNMPGIASLSEMTAVNLDDIALKVDASGRKFSTSDLVIWSKQDVSDSDGLKNKIAELVAAIGPDLKDGLCLDFSR